MQNVNIYHPPFAQPIRIGLWLRGNLDYLGYTLSVMAKQVVGPIEIYFTAAMGDLKLNHNIKYFHKG